MNISDGASLCYHCHDLPFLRESDVRINDQDFVRTLSFENTHGDFSVLRASREEVQL